MHRLVSVALVILMGGLAIASRAEVGREKAAVCAACHGADGNSTTAEWPKLAGQHASYLNAQLAAFKSGARSNALMNPIVANLSDDDMTVLADFFAAQKVQPGSAKKELVDAGAKVYRGGNAESGVPACMACHGPRGAGNPAAGYPSLYGQHATYITVQLKAYNNGERSTDANAIMRNIAQRMTTAEMEAVASYIEGLH